MGTLPDFEVSHNNVPPLSPSLIMVHVILDAQKHRQLEKVFHAVDGKA